MSSNAQRRSAFLTATIANGQSLSGPVNVDQRPIIGVLMPAAWTPAVLSFQTSLDGITYRNVFLSTGAGVGAEYSIGALLGQQVMFDKPIFGANHVKVRSGLSSAAAAQGQASSVVLICQDVAGA